MKHSWGALAVHVVFFAILLFLFGFQVMQIFASEKINSGALAHQMINLCAKNHLTRSNLHFHILPCQPCYARALVFRRFSKNSNLVQFSACLSLDKQLCTTNASDCTCSIQEQENYPRVQCAYSCHCNINVCIYRNNIVNYNILVYM